MAMNAREAHIMRTASRQKTHLIAQIVPSPMTLRVDNTIKRLIAEGYLGDVLAIEARAGGGISGQRRTPPVATRFRSQWP